MRIPFVLTACSSVVGLCILATLGACVGDDVAAAPGPGVADGGADTSSPGTDSGGAGDSSTGADAGADAAPPPSTGAHKFAKSYAGLYETGAIGVSGEEVFAAGQGGTAIDLDGIPLAAATSAIVTKLDATGKAAWGQSFVGTGGNPSVRPAGVAANVTAAYVAGTFDTSTLVFGADTLSRPTTLRAGFIASLHVNDGTPSWARAIQTTSTNYTLTCAGVAATAAGVAVGCTVDQTTVSIGTMAASTSYTAGVAGGSNDFVVVMFDTAGAVKWANFFTGAGNDVLGALAADPSGDVVLLASVGSTTLADKLTGASLGKPAAAGAQGVPFVARLGAADGKITWSKFLGVGNATARALAVSGDGKKIAVAGTITAPVDFGIGSLAPVGATNAGDAFVLVLDGTTRAPLWQKQIGGSGDKGSEDARGVAFDAYGQVAVVGLNRSTDTKIDATPVPSPPQPVDTGWGSFAVKLGPAGNVLWTKGFSSQNVNDAIGIESVAFTAKGELRAGGGLQGTAPLDGVNNTTAAVAYQMVLLGWQP
jgi:hypothetical protein